MKMPPRATTTIRAGNIPDGGVGGGGVGHEADAAAGPVVGLLLASGFGRRFDAGGRRNKLLATLPDGRTLISAAAHALCDALEHVAVVVPARGTLIEAALSDLALRLIRNPRAKDGIGASIAVGIAALRMDFPNARGWLIALGDMPFIAPETIRAVADTLPTIGGNASHHGARNSANSQADHHEIVAAAYRGRRGHPVAFARTLGPELMMLDSDIGAARLLETRGVRLVDCDDPGVLRDIDTREDLARVEVASTPS